MVAYFRPVRVLFASKRRCVGARVFVFKLGRRDPSQLARAVKWVMSSCSSKIEGLLIGARIGSVAESPRSVTMRINNNRGSYFRGEIISGLIGAAVPKWRSKNFTCEMG